MAEINTWPGWECVRQLGAGSFGKVYEIQKIEHGKVYKSALKVISIPQNDADIENAYSEGLDRNGVTEYFKSFVNDFTNEIALMSDLKGYTNIVSYEDHMVIPHEDKIGWDILIKMELLTPLLEWEKEHSLQENDIIRLGIDMCRALELCHKNKIIHRDIKPQNIFVNKNGDFKLGDFGIARVVEKTSSVMSQKGTYTYMAPEVFRGQYYNESADIYSLGIVLYRCLNQNRTPFLPLGNMNFNDRQTAQERRMAGEEIPEPVSGNEELKQAVLMTLRYNPGKRIQSAAMLRNILEQCWMESDNTAPPASKAFSKTQNVDSHIQQVIPAAQIIVSEEQIEVTKVQKTTDNSHNSVNTQQFGNDFSEYYKNAETSKHGESVFEETIDDEKTVLSNHVTTVQQKKKNKTVIIVTLVIAVVAVLGLLIAIGSGPKENLSKTDDSEIIDVGECAEWRGYGGVQDAMEVWEIESKISPNRNIIILRNDNVSYWVFELPQEVTSFVEEGWNIKENLSIESLESAEGGWCVVETDKSSLYLMLYNDSTETKELKDCKVVGILGDETLNGKFAIKGGYDYDSDCSRLDARYDDYIDSYKREDGTSFYVWNDIYNIQMMKSVNGFNDALLFIDPEFAKAYYEIYEDIILLWELIK